MFRFFFKNRNKEFIQDEFLAPETKPVIGKARIFITDKNEKTVPTEKISYRLINKRRREEDHNFY